MTESIGFHVDGEFITDLARTWFWEEHRPTETCLNLIKVCCSGMDEATQNEIACSILEGRKKLVGIDTFTLEDDNEQVRTLMDKIIAEEKENKISQIRFDMAGNFRKYVDKFATIKSTHIDALSLHGMPATFQECREYFTMERNSIGLLQDISYGESSLFDTPTMGGLWLINEPETVYAACKGDLYLIGKDDFWQNIYELKKDNPAFSDRNERYLYSIQPKPNFEERMKTLVEAFEKKHPELYSVENEPEFETPEWFEYQFIQTKDRQYNMHPDDMETWEGLIAPNGDFYSVDFGGHNHKAYNLLITHAEQFGQTSEYFRTSPDIRADNALDTLLAYGWCATRSVMFEQYVLPPTESLKKPTKQQINRIFDLVTKHDVHINIDELLFYLE